MRPLDLLLREGRALRALGFDDAPHRAGGGDVGVCGVVVRDVRVEGVLWDAVPRDGHAATATLASMLLRSRQHAQVSVVLLDGITVAGLDVVDVAALAEALARPVVAVLRRPPDVAAFDRALGRTPDADARRARWRGAGPLHRVGRHVFHAAGVAPEVAAAALERLCVHGHVPEPLRLAHLIARGVTLGESRGRA